MAGSAGDEKNRRHRRISAEIQSLFTISVLSAFVLLFVALVSLRFYWYQGALVREVDTLARFLGQSARGAVAFNDADAAQRFISGLSAESSIARARILSANDKIPTLAEYHRLSTHSPSLHWLPILEFDVSHDIVLDGERIGRVEISVSTREFYFVLMTTGGIVFSILLLAFWLARSIAFRLRFRIVQPLERLASTIERVREDKDFGVEAAAGSASAEVQSLVSGFNEMIREIDSQAQKLNSEKVRAEEALSVKSQFMANVSHELRTPLHGVIGMLGLLEADELSPEQAEFVQIAQSSANNLLQLVSDLLEFSTIEAGRVYPRPRNWVVRDLLKGIISGLRPRLEEKELTVTMDVADEIPESLYMDGDRIGQILLNLFFNAVKFTPHGGRISLVVNVIGREANELMLEFHVRDTGIGIPANRIEFIFEEFFQVESGDTRSYGGIGLGLAITRELVGLLGGKIEVVSELGHGSTFSFTSPMLLVDEATALVSTEDEASTGDDEPRNDNSGNSRAWELRALVVDDHPTALFVMEKLLERLGVEVHSARGAFEASELFRAESYDFVLMDCRMPGTNGFEAAVALREIEKELGRARTPIVAVTAYALQADQDRCIEAGMDGFVSKPVLPTALREELKKHVDISSLTQAFIESGGQIQ